MPCPLECLVDQCREAGAAGETAMPSRRTSCRRDAVAPRPTVPPKPAIPRSSPLANGSQVHTVSGRCEIQWHGVRRRQDEDEHGLNAQADMEWELDETRGEVRFLPMEA